MIRPEIWGWSSRPLSVYAWGWDDVGAPNVLSGIPHLVLDGYIQRIINAHTELRLVCSTTGLKIIHDGFAPSVVRYDDTAKSVKETYLQKTLKTEIRFSVSQEEAMPSKVCHADDVNHFSATKAPVYIIHSNPAPKIIH